MRRTLWLAALCGALVLSARVGAQTPDITGGMLIPGTLGEEVNRAGTITTLRVESVDRAEEVITFRRAADLKGAGPDGPIRHHIDMLGSERDRRAVLDWARPGQMAVCFQDRDRCRTCLGSFWYLGVAEEPTSWNAVFPLEGCPVTYAGPVEKLLEHVAAILARREVVVTAQALEDNEYYRRDWQTPVYRDWLHGRKGRVCRVRAGLRIVSLDETASEGSRGFVGWGVGGPEAVPSLAAALADRDPLVRAEAAGDLGQLGDLSRPALPALRAALRDPDPFVRVYAAEAVARIDPEDRGALEPLAAALRHPDGAVGNAAAGALAGLGPRALASAPALRAALRQDPAEVRSAAALALGEVIPEAAPRGEETEESVAALVRALREDRSADVSYWAARALLKFGPAARNALPALVAALRDRGRPAARDVAADVLSRLGPDAVPLLGEALLDPQCGARRHVAQYLGDMGPAARPAVPALLRTLQAEDPWLRFEAASALMHIDPDAAAAVAVPVLGALLDREKGAHVRWKAVAVLGQLGPRAQPAVPDLALVLQDEALPMRRSAAVALGNIGPGAGAAAPGLTALLRDDDRGLRVEAARALWRIDRGREAVAFVIRACDEKGEQRVRAVDALGEMGPEAARAVPALRKALQDPDESARVPIALALWRLQRRVEGPGLVSDPRQGALAVLTRLLREGRPEERWSAAAAVRRIGPEARPAVPALVGCLRDEDPGLREEAADALGAIDPDAGEATAALTNLLGDRSPSVRLAAARALARRGLRPAELVPVLTRILQRSPDLIDEVAAVLATCGADARAAVPPLRRLLRHNDHAIAAAAARALGQIDTAGEPRRQRPP
jgi:HEAT repeat protein